MKTTTKKMKPLRTLQTNELAQVAGGYGLNNGFDQEGTSAGYRGSWVEKR